MQDLLDDFKSKYVANEPISLNVDRNELWRTALGFYKKALNKPEMLKRAFEVCMYKTKHVQ